MSLCPVSWWPFTKKQRDLSVTFVTSLPYLQDAYPIYSAKQIPMPWIKESQEWAVPRQEEYTKGRIHGMAHRCSGIMTFINKGWVLPAWHDFVITTNGDGHSIKTELPSSAPKNAMGVATVGGFHPSYFGDLPSAPLPARTLKTILKIHTPWSFNITPGWGLIMLPLEYIKEHRFTSTTGILNPSISNGLNAVLYWHVLNGSTLIKAGTPLCRLLPIPIDDRWTHTVREETNEEAKYHKARRFFQSSQWVTDHTLLIRLYRGMMNR